MDEKYFENLANGVKEFNEEDAKPIKLETTSEDAASEMGNYEVELARANVGAIATRGAKTNRSATRTEKQEAWDDAEPEGQLTLDVYQTPDTIVVESAIAGVRPEDIDINVTTDSISIKGVRHREQEVSDKDYLYQECYWGKFSRSVILPQEVDPENAEVAFKNGILTVRLPKVNKKKTRKLRVRID